MADKKKTQGWWVVAWVGLCIVLIVVAGIWG